ncbi:hypothetical protein BS78_K124400 [Paspalum vaginatum]|uniref:Uncharacterized protein n=1 Tax=Paspalum vaginatum TaxID=158149 RepID=A0A9W7X839_9POAL|nr:hypothetical protein BS78_K124400 [Paspalum vaginatum]
MSSSSEEEQSANELEAIAGALHLLRLIKKRKRARRRRGSVVGRQNTLRPIQEGAKHLETDFFQDSPIYGPHFFRRRFRMKKELLLRIEKALLQYKPEYFEQRRDCMWRNRRFNPG